MRTERRGAVRYRRVFLGVVLWKVDLSNAFCPNAGKLRFGLVAARAQSADTMQQGSVDAFLALWMESGCMANNLY